MSLHFLSISGNILTAGDTSYRCAIGKNGLSKNKEESDGCTPIGEFALRECWYRADRLKKPESQLTLRIIEPDDGWCDDPVHPLYNKHFKITETGKDEPASFERLWREDEIYDLIVPLGYNDDPVIPGKGSAIFLHIATPDYTPTEGCVALAGAELLNMLQYMTPLIRLRIG